MANQDIRSYAKEKGIKLWQVAEIKGISEPTMTRLMRTEMTNETKADIIHIIDELADKCISKTKANKKSDMGTEKMVCIKCGVELDVPIYENDNMKKYGSKHCHQCGAALLNPEEKETLLSIRQGIAAKYGYTQEQVTAYWQGVEDAQSELAISMMKAGAIIAQEAVGHERSVRYD